MLHHDRHIRFEHGGMVGIAWHRLRVVEIIEAQVQGAARRHRYLIRPDRFLVGEEQGDDDVRVAVAGVEDAGGLVRDQRPFGKRAF